MRLKAFGLGSAFVFFGLVNSLIGAQGEASDSVPRLVGEAYEGYVHSAAVVGIKTFRAGSPIVRVYLKSSLEGQVPEKWISIRMRSYQSVWLDLLLAALQSNFHVKVTADNIGHARLVEVVRSK